MNIASNMKQRHIVPSLQVQKAKAATHVVAKGWLSACQATGKREDEAAFLLADDEAAGKASSSSSTARSTAVGVGSNNISARGSSNAAASRAFTASAPPAARVPAPAAAAASAPPLKRVRLPPGDGQLSRSDVRSRSQRGLFKMFYLALADARVQARGLVTQWVKHETDGGCSPLCSHSTMFPLGC